MGPIETSHSDARRAFLHAQNYRGGLEPTETCNSSPKISVLQAQNQKPLFCIQKPHMRAGTHRDLLF